jgi:hypothetical protein
LCLTLSVSSGVELYCIVEYGVVRKKYSLVVGR